MTNSKHILIVDDEKDILDLVASSLAFAGFEVDKAENGNLALSFIIEENDYDLIVCDVMMPDLGGFSLVEKIREFGIITPVLFLTAKSSLDNKLKGFSSGADDYMVKPFSVEELIARVNAILKRTTSQISPIKSKGENCLEIGEMTIDFDRKVVKIDNRICELTPTEFKLLELLAQNQGRVVSKDEILINLWGDSDYLDKPSEGYAVIEAYISYLRKKIDIDKSESFIQTKRGMGYMVEK